MIQNDTTPLKRKKGAGFGRRIQQSLKIDMTPMVDLGFLLITFFVITTELSKPTVMDITMPKESDYRPNEIGDSYVLTVIPDGEKVIFYEGAFEKAMIENKVAETTIGELRKIILRKQLNLDDTTRYKDGREGLMLLVKPTEKANYKSVVDVLDECIILQVKKYAVLKISNKEKDWVKTRN